MNYQNAYNGIKKIFVAEMLSVSASLLGILALIISFFMMNDMGKTVKQNGETVLSSAEDARTILLLISVFSIAMAVLLLIAVIVKFLGISSAAKDEPVYNTALALAIIGLIITIVNTVIKIFMSNEFLENILTVSVDIISFLITVLVIQGIRNIAAKLGKDDMVRQGGTIFYLIIAIYLLIIAERIVVVVIGDGIIGLSTTSVLGISAYVLSIVQYILYLIYLNKAKKMLEYA